ncbi:MAG TPA: kelch repeat-containing protein [Candidatus Binatia bacterium]|nr:kelch repeat-containing protein [Candidatus Binatia bacterium]
MATRTPAPGQLAPTGNTTTARFSHTATLLLNGKVLIAGGMERNGVWLDSAELYDPAKGRFSLIGKMSARRAGATATLLPNGKVLIAGGTDGSGKNLASAEIYDPDTNTFSATGNLSFPRGHAIATLLKNGTVLIAGGNAAGDDDQLASAEIYDPLTGLFLPTGSMHSPRSYFIAVRLEDGKVLVAGGLSGGQFPFHKVEATAEVYHPLTGRFTLTGEMSVPRYKQGAALLPDGKVLIAGGSNEDGRQNKYSSTEIFDLQMNAFHPGPRMRFPRYKLLSGVTPLSDGRVLVAGGAELPEIYDPARAVFVALNDGPLDGFLFSTATLLPDGRVLMVDGYGQHPAEGAVNHATLWKP